MPDSLTGPVLAIDSATAACSAAVWGAGRVLASRFEIMSRGQDQALLPMIRDAMSEAGIAYRDLSGIGVTVGPGSFTGMRVGLAAARGLALATGLPLVGITTLEAIAAAVSSASPFLVAVDSKRRDLYVQIFADGHPASGIVVLPPNGTAALLDADPLPVAGDGAGMIAATGLRIAPLGPVHPRAADFASLVAVRLRETAPGAAPRPLYLRAPEVTLALPVA